MSGHQAHSSIHVLVRVAKIVGLLDLVAPPCVFFSPVCSCYHLCGWRTDDWAVACSGVSGLWGSWWASLCCLVVGLLGLRGGLCAWSYWRALSALGAGSAVLAAVLDKRISKVGHRVFTITHGYTCTHVCGGRGERRAVRDKEGRG